MVRVNDFSVHTGSLGSASRVIGTDAANLQSDFVWLGASESFEDGTISSAVAELLLTWRITAEQIVGDLYEVAGNLRAAGVAYSAADRAVAQDAREFPPPVPKPPSGEPLA
jgi:hypothetical protein